MLALKCLGCGLTVPYKGSRRNVCPRCLVREDRAIELTTVSDRPSTISRSRGRLTTYTREQEDRHTIVLSGELDIASVQILDEILTEACAAGAKEVVLDLGGIEFMDSEGLNAILRGKARCEQQSCTYCVTPAQRPVEHVFDTAGIRGKLLRKRS
jgi:anti-anti-sigma factor